MTRPAPGPRHPLCGGEWRGPLASDDGDREVCNTCGEERAVTELLTASEAAAQLRVSVRTLDRWIRAGLLTPIPWPSTHRRFLAADVDALRKPSDPAPTVNEAP